MNEKLKTILFLTLLSIFHSSFAQTKPQNLCRDAYKTGATDAFAEDPSSCDRFLLCNYDASGNVVKVQQGKCLDAEHPVFFKGACYPDTEVDCGVDATVTPEPDRVICPGLDNTNLMYAIDVDPATEEEKCQKYTFCDTTNGNPTVPESCTRTAVFDRSSGTCASPTFAPCEIYNLNNGESNVCPPGVTEPTPVEYPGTCNQYVICFDDGTQSAPYTCTGDWHFNPDEGSCDEPQYRRPPCSVSSSVTYRGRAPVPPNRSKYFGKNIPVRRLYGSVKL